MKGKKREKIYDAAHSLSSDRLGRGCHRCLFVVVYFYYCCCCCSSCSSYSCSCSCSALGSFHEGMCCRSLHALVEKSPIAHLTRRAAQLTLSLRLTLHLSLSPFHIHSSPAACVSLRVWSNLLNRHSLSRSMLDVFVYYPVCSDLLSWLAELTEKKKRTAFKVESVVLCYGWLRISCQSPFFLLLVATF